MDYSRVMRGVAAVEGLRVEDLVKQYFETAEQVRPAPPPPPPQVHRAPPGLSLRGRVPTDGAAVPADRAGHGQGHPGVRGQGREGRHRGADHLPVGENAAPPPGQRSHHRAGYRHRGTLLTQEFTQEAGEERLFFKCSLMLSGPEIQRV